MTIRTVALAAALLPAAITHLLVPSRGARAEEVVLAESGEARLPIRIATDADDRVASLAEEIRQLLSKMVATDFSLQRGLDGPGLRLKVQPGNQVALYQREKYTIRCSDRTVTLTGSTPLAVEHAAWDLMHRLGYRQYFPGSTWEVVPALPQIRIDLNVSESPDYHFRRIWYGYGLWDYNSQPYQKWCRRNRMGGGVRVNSGHAYGRIIRAKQDVFAEHPEFYALLDGKRHIHPQAKLCIGNSRLRATVVEYAREFFAANPHEDCISVDPSDGGGWCECSACKQVGSPSDRALLLANEVADAVRPRLVGMYAYNYHSSPPTIRAQPNVCINAATAFIKGGATIDEIMTGWSRQGATLGIREYYSVNTWDRDLPGAARGSNLAYLSNTIPFFHRQGARFMNAESSDNWGCNGLGYYFASRALWDIDAVDQREEVINDFVQKSFGPGATTMREYYGLIAGENTKSKLVHTDLLARMYRVLRSARGQVGDESPEQARIDHLILYTRFVDLFHVYQAADGPARQAAFEQMIRHVYRIRSTMMVHAKALYRDVPARDKRIVVPENCRWSVPEGRNPWKASQEFGDAEIETILATGVANYSPLKLDFELRDFGRQLEFASELLGSDAIGTTPIASAKRGRGRRSWYTRFRRPGQIVLHIKGGLIAHYRDRGNVKVSVYKLGGSSESGELQTLVAKDETVPPDGEQHSIRLAVEDAGLYRIDLNDGMDMTEVSWPDDQPMTWKLTLEDHPHMFTGRWNLWFYVPKGTSKLGLYVDASGGKIVDPTGKVVLDLNHRGGQFVSANVPDGTDGRLWKLSHVAGKVCLLNVPPYAARTASQLLLPVDCVK